MKLLPLSSGKAFAKVSDCDFDHLNKFKWTLQVNKKPNVTKLYAARWVEGKRKRNGKRQKQKRFLHREVMEAELSTAPKGYVVDHFPDKDGLNCQRENLRVVSQAKNLEHILEECKGCYCKPEDFNPICCPHLGVDKSNEW